MNTVFSEIRNNWWLGKNACRTTLKKNFTEKEPTEDFKKKMLISEHSPIRLLEFYWKWIDIPYFVAMEWARHKFEKFISSQRNDRQQEYDRNVARQDTPVIFDGFANMQNLIDVWRKRLCFQATKEARELAENFKVELHKTNKLESDVLVPNCVYRGGCPEFQTCGYMKKFMDWVTKNDVNFDLCDIQQRYDLYNQYFYEMRK